MFGLKVEVTPTYAFANMKETTTEYTDLGVTYKETTVFENNEKTNKPDRVSGNETTSYEHGQPRVSFSSVALNVGVNIGF